MTTTTTTITLEAWLERAAKVKTATRELVKLWLLNELGCQKELANHLGLTDRAIRKHVSNLRDAGELPQVAETDGRSRTNRSAATTERNSVPNSVPRPTDHGDTPVVSLSDYRDSRQQQEEEPSTEVADLRAEVERLMAENEELRKQLEAAATPPAPTITKEQSQKLSESMAPGPRLEAETFIWWSMRSRHLNEMQPYLEQLMAELQEHGATYEQPGSMDPDRWERIYVLLNPLFEEIDNLAAYEDKYLKEEEGS